MDILTKDQLETSLHEEKKLIENGKMKDDNPLDVSEMFNMLCEACRRGDLKMCQETVSKGVNINACDRFDYTPLILASLCGHYEVVQFLLESGALCQRDTFQGERCLYNALNDRIRNLLLSYDYSKSTNKLQPFASHVTSLLFRETPKISDILLVAAGEAFHLHKFILCARSPYFSRKLSVAPETTSWKIPPTISPQAFGIAIRYIYLGEVPIEVGGTEYLEDEVLEGIDKISKQLEIRSLWDGILECGNPRLARQWKVQEMQKGRSQLEAWFRENVLKYKVLIDTAKADSVRWDRDNAIFADVLLRADEINQDSEPETALDNISPPERSALPFSNGIPVGPVSHVSRNSSRSRTPQKSILFPVHRAMLIRSEFFRTMFSSAFREAQPSAHLQIIPIDCSPEVLEVVLTFLYAEETDIPLDLAIDVLFAADLLLIEKLKMQAAVIISTLGSGSLSAQQNTIRSSTGEEMTPEEETINVYDIVRAGWLTRVPRLEEFGARYLAYRLENYINEDEFAELIQESASRIKGRQETDSIELLDEIRYYLSERFRLRFEDAYIEEMMDEAAASPPRASSTSNQPATIDPPNPTTTEQHDPNNATQMQTLTLDNDEFASDAINYQFLLKGIDELLLKLGLDA